MTLGPFYRWFNKFMDKFDPTLLIGTKNRPKILQSKNMQYRFSFPFKAFSGKSWIESLAFLLKTPNISFSTQNKEERKKSHNGKLFMYSNWWIFFWNCFYDSFDSKLFYIFFAIWKSNFYWLVDDAKNKIIFFSIMWLSHLWFLKISTFHNLNILISFAMRRSLLLLCKNNDINERI